MDWLVALTTFFSELLVLVKSIVTPIGISVFDVWIGLTLAHIAFYIIKAVFGVIPNDDLDNVD